MNEAPASHRVEGGVLHVVATPIGNLEDIGQRGLRVLREVDVIAAEDTRVTARLLSRYAISAQPMALHAHNEQRRVEQIIGLLASGKSVALVSDAGTPGVSDPGALLVKAVRAAGYRVMPIPGPSALSSALSVSGFTDRHILFCGFLPARPGARQGAIAELNRYTAALVFYEAPHRVLECVADLAGGLSQPEQRRLVIAREITKLYESIHECALPEAAAWLEADLDRQRGEFVLMVSGLENAVETPQWEQTLVTLLAELPLAQAVKLTCSLTGARRKPVYDRALEIKGAI